MTVSYQNLLYSSQDYSSDVALASLQSSAQQQQQQQQMFGSSAGPLSFRSAATTTEHPAIGAIRHQHQHLRHPQDPDQQVYLQQQLPQQPFQSHAFPQSHLFLHSVPFRHRPTSTHPHVSSMAQQQQQQEQQPHLTEEELSQLQKLSAEYQPEHSVRPFMLINIFLSSLSSPHFDVVRGT